MEEDDQLSELGVSYVDVGEYEQSYERRVLFLSMLTSR